MESCGCQGGRYSQEDKRQWNGNIGTKNFLGPMTLSGSTTDEKDHLAGEEVESKVELEPSFKE